jgi:hypothetical protein
MQLGEQKTKNKKQILEFCFLFFVKSKQLGRKKPKKMGVLGQNFLGALWVYTTNPLFLQAWRPLQKVLFLPKCEIKIPTNNLTNTI